MVGPLQIVALLLLYQADRFYGLISTRSHRSHGVRRTSSLAHLGLTSLLLRATKHVETVTKESSQKRVDVYLSGLTMGRSRSYFNSLIQRGKVLVNNKVVTKSYKVCDGDVVEFEVEEKAISSVEAEEIPLDILFEDDVTSVSTRDIFCEEDVFSMSRKHILRGKKTQFPCEEDIFSL